MGWERVTGAFADSGARAHTVLATDAVAQAWRDASILPQMTIGDIAGHLLAVLIMFDRRYELTAPPEVVATDAVGGGYSTVRLAHASDAAAAEAPRTRSRTWARWCSR